MELKIDICSLIKKGGVYYDVPGDTVEEVYKNVCQQLDLPEGITGEQLCTELLKREKIMSTAVGNGIALPHPRPLILKENESQRIVLFFPKNRLDMSAPDERLVSACFILLTSNVNDHMQILSQIADLVQKVSIRCALEDQASEEELFTEIQRYQNN
ncbi:MAG: PTS sugar transporter subunit IIA [Spirochaetaceae bacterium]|nr:PTS sugar transporter subunit IIA [Spirochaetaceae bacterium]MBO5236347.1 PTS sugar transporter subunit IIA [Spirochaetaceae bacterium]